MDTQYFEHLFSLDGRKAVVTGASGGIGRAIAESLARFGADVAVLGRSQEKLREAEGAILAFGGKCSTWAFDVADPEQTESFFRDYTAKYGAPDIFVANAGATVHKHVLDTTDEEMDRLVGTDLKGVIYGLRRAGNLMKERGRGNIVVVTSVNALYPLPDQAFYSGIKCALEGIVRCLASDLGPFGVRVNTLAPGAVNTDLGRDLGKHHSETVIPCTYASLGHVAQPEEMGPVAACMVSDAFRYMTGSTVLVDGGLMLRK